MSTFDLTTDFNDEKLARLFTKWIMDHRASMPHVQRVIYWFYPLLQGINKVADKRGVGRSRQLWFRASNRFYKVRFWHGMHYRGRQVGGLEIVERHGARDGQVIAQFPTLEAVEAFARDPFAVIKHVRAAGGGR